MEQYEAGLIELDAATVEICSAFPNCPDYDEYRQWSINLGGCSINAITRTARLSPVTTSREGGVVVISVMLESQSSLHLSSKRRV